MLSKTAVFGYIIPYMKVEPNVLDFRIFYVCNKEYIVSKDTLLKTNMLSAKELVEIIQNLEDEKIKLLEDEKKLRKEAESKLLLFEIEIAAIRKDVKYLQQITSELEDEKIKLLEDEKKLRKEAESKLMLLEHEIETIKKDVESLKQISLVI